MPGRFVPPDVPQSSSPPLVVGEVWTSNTLGYSFEYDPRNFNLSHTDDSTAILDGGPGEIVVRGTTGDVSVDQMIQDQLSTIDTLIIGRAPDSADADAVLGAAIGYVDGRAEVYSGTLQSDNGTPSGPANITIVGASNGHITVAVIVIVANPEATSAGPTNLHLVRLAADQILKTFSWGGQ